MATRRARRFPLLLYKRYHQTRKGLSQFLIALGILSLGGLVALKIFAGAAINSDAFILMLGCGLALLAWGIARFLFTFFASKTAFVECRARSLKIQTPFIPLVISYRRIKDNRPSVLRELFPPDQQKRDRNLLETYWGETVVVIDVNKLPLPPRLLKAVMGPYFFNPDGSGLALLVDDWMAFNQTLDQALSEYRSQRASQRG